MNVTRIPLALVLFLSLAAIGHAQTGNVIPFQGQLANQAGVPLSPSNAVTVVFRLYPQPIGGNAIWEESQPSVSVNAGRFSVLLGSRVELPGPTNFNSTVYLGITADDGNPATADVEMRPRQAIIPVINAAYARNANKLDGFDWSALFGSANPIDGKLSGSRIVDDSITAMQVASGAIGPAEIAQEAVQESRIASGAISSRAIQNLAVTTPKIQDQGVTLSKLAQEVLDFLVPPGTVIAFAGDTNRIPRGWLLCDGSVRDRSVYLALFNAIGTAWGADNASTFRVPDLRGMFLRGADMDAGRDPDKNSRTASNIGGSTGNAVGSAQVDQLRSHQHNYSGHEFWSDRFASGYPSGVMALTKGDGLYHNTHTDVFGNHAVDNDNLGSIRPSGGNETRPKNAYVNYIIKY